MNLIKTKSFELAILTRGKEDSKNLAILIPGRLDTKDYENFVSHAEYLADRGFFVVAFDPPGTWESRGGIEMYTTTNYLKAVDELIEYFGSRPTLLLGHSRGGAVAMLESMKNSKIIGIVSVMGSLGAPTELSEEVKKDGFKISYRDVPPGSSKTKELKKFALPVSYWEDGKLYDPAKALKGCTKPKLIVYGTRDEFLPDEVKKIFKTIPEPKMIQKIDSDHDYRRNADAIQ
ncbi:MAG: alpha/beta fold hydrolase, partial [Candidatus Pacebacteria bacterium]|nr:alpha/beta fold hydrolase [Candidatus Paceibacterota bacterium]